MWIPMLWVFGHSEWLILPVRGSSLDVRFWRLYTSDSKDGPRTETVKPSWCPKETSLKSDLIYIPKGFGPKSGIPPPNLNTQPFHMQVGPLNRVEQLIIIEY